MCGMCVCVSVCVCVCVCVCVGVCVCVSVLKEKCEKKSTCKQDETRDNFFSEGDNHFSTSGVDPTKLFFFATEEFFCFFAGKLAFSLHTEKKLLIVK
jgi:hypothetical protein